MAAIKLRLLTSDLIKKGKNHNKAIIMLIIEYFSLTLKIKLKIYKIKFPFY